MKIQNDRFAAMFTLHNSPDQTRETRDKVRAARKEDPALDRALYDADMAALHDEIAKVEVLAKKVARGEQLSNEEREFLQQNSPEVLRTAEEARQRAKEIGEALKQADGSEERQQILSSAMMEIDSSLKGGNEKYAEYVIEALSAQGKDQKSNNGIESLYTQLQKGLDKIGAHPVDIRV